MGTTFRATSHIKWFRVEENCVDGEKPLAQIAGSQDSGPEWYCLKQLWIGDNGKEDWRDIGMVP